MKISKAIKILQDESATQVERFTSEYSEAIKLGIEALKCILHDRQVIQAKHILLLPGERHRMKEAQLREEKAMELRLCNHAARCGNYNCPHYYPHYSNPSPSVNGLPQCEGKGVYCYEKGWYVQCEVIKRARHQP